MRTIEKSRVVLLVTGLMLVASCGEQEGTDTPAPQDTAPATAGIEIGEVTLGRAIGADKAVTDATTTFQPGDTIYAVVHSDGAAPSATLAARWTYEDGQLVSEETQTIAPTGPATTEFHISNPAGWPAGDYEVEISLDGEPVETAAFTVEGG